MPGRPQRTGGGAGKRKWGRQYRSPAHARYLADGHWLRNKARRMRRANRFHPEAVPALLAAVRERWDAFMTRRNVEGRGK